MSFSVFMETISNGTIISHRVLKQPRVKKVLHFKMEGKSLLMSTATHVQTFALNLKSRRARAWKNTASTLQTTSAPEPEKMTLEFLSSRSLAEDHQDSWLQSTCRASNTFCLCLGPSPETAWSDCIFPQN